MWNRLRGPHSGDGQVIFGTEFELDSFGDGVHHVERAARSDVGREEVGPLLVDAEDHRRLGGAAVGPADVGMVAVVEDEGRGVPAAGNRVVDVDGPWIDRAEVGAAWRGVELTFEAQGIALGGRETGVEIGFPAPLVGKPKAQEAAIRGDDDG